MSFPLTPPAAPSVRRVTIKPESAVAVQRSPFTLQQQAVAWPGQAWTLQVELPPMQRDLAEEWIAFFCRLNGSEGTFLYGDPLAYEPRGIPAGGPVVSGAGQSGSALVTSGWTPFVFDALLPGDYVQIGEGSTSRLHKVLEAVETDESGNATLQLWPRLRETPADGSDIVLYGARGQFRLTDFPGWDADHMRIYGVSFAAVEAL